MEADNSSDMSEDSMQYCSVGEAMRPTPLTMIRKLREFIENVDVVFELLDPSKHYVLLKFVKAKITRGA